MERRGAALVTGGSRGIGRAIAVALAQDGYDLTLVARSADALDEVAAALGAHDRRVEVVAADLADTAVAGGAVDAHVAAHGDLDVLVLAAGMSRFGGVADTSAPTLAKLLAINVDAAFALAAAALPALRRSHGLVAVLASIAGLQPTPGFAGYSASKAALVSLARSIAAEEGAAGVRACAICPAFVDTAMTASVPVASDAMLRPADVAEAVRFLLRLSPTASVTELVLGRAGAPPLAP